MPVGNILSANITTLKMFETIDKHKYYLTLKKFYNWYQNRAVFEAEPEMGYNTKIS